MKKLLSDYDKAERALARNDAKEKLRQLLVIETVTTFNAKKLYVVKKHVTKNATWIQVYCILGGELYSLEMELRLLFSDDFVYDSKRGGFRFYHGGGQSPFWECLQRLGMTLYPDGYRRQGEVHQAGYNVFQAGTIL